MKEILCIDFDGTIVKPDFPRIGEPIEGAIETLKLLKEAGFILILWTCRENEGYIIYKQYLTDAVEWCKEQGIDFDGVNETPIEVDFRPEECLNRKVHADIYIDDRNFGGFPGWDVIQKELV